MSGHEGLGGPRACQLSGYNLAPKAGKESGMLDRSILLPETMRIFFSQRSLPVVVA